MGLEDDALGLGILHEVTMGRCIVPEYVARDHGYDGAVYGMKMYRLVDSGCVAVAPNERGEFESRVLGLGIQPDGDRLRVRDLGIRKPIPIMSELTTVHADGTACPTRGGHGTKRCRAEGGGIASFDSDFERIVPETQSQ